MILTGKNVQLKFNTITRTIADSISVNFDNLFLVFRDFQGNIHTYSKKPKISGTITEFIDDFDTLNDFILSAKMAALDILADTGTKLKLRLIDVVFEKFDFDLTTKGLMNVSVAFKANDYEIGQYAYDITYRAGYVDVSVP